MAMTTCARLTRNVRPLGGLVGRGAALVALGLLPLVAGCTKAQQQGTGSSYLIISSLEGASGAKPTEFSAVLDSDVVTMVKQDVNGTQVPVATIFDDPGRVTFRLGLKDPGSSDSPTSPTPANFITISRYHVEYVRADGRNTPGVDVPYPFDGAITGTVGSANTTLGLILVRIQAKAEAPLAGLAGGAGFAISTIARVTFYGTDQTGHDASVTGTISINFANWGDPQ
jgi:hypothetical protein